MVLSFFRLSVSSDGVALLCTVKCWNLTDLNLDGNEIGPEGCHSIASFLGKIALVSLNLANNKLLQGG